MKGSAGHVGKWAKLAAGVVAAGAFGSAGAWLAEGGSPELGPEAAGPLRPMRGIEPAMAGAVLGPGPEISRHRTDPGVIWGDMIAEREAAASDGPDACTADCNGDRVIDAFDILCFQRAFEARDAAADCDKSTGEGVFDVLDLVCFQRAFLEGCG